MKPKRYEGDEERGRKLIIQTQYLKNRELTKREFYFRGNFLNLEELEINSSFLKFVLDETPLFFRDLKFNSVGTYGMVFENEDFIVKFPNPEINRGEIITHEAFIGTILNEMRKEIPNFVYTYYYGMSQYPLLERVRGKVLPFFDEGDVPFVILEKVKGHDLSYYLQFIGVDDFQSIFFQCVFSIILTNEKFGFTHFDLHDSNVIIKQSEPVKVEYHLFSGKKVITTTFIAVIIDFGMSLIRKDRTNFGLPSECKLEHYGILYEPNVLTDIYKLICNCAKNTRRSNRGIFSYLEKLFLFFNEIESLDSVIVKQKKYSYFYPPSNKSVEDFVEYALTLPSIPVICSLEPNWNEPRDSEKIIPLILPPIPNERILMKPIIPPSIFTISSLLSNTSTVPRWMGECIEFLREYFPLRPEEYRNKFEKIVSDAKKIYDFIYDIERLSFADMLREKRESFEWYFSDFHTFKSLF